MPSNFRLSLTNLKRLEVQDNLKKHEDNSYLQDTKNANFSYIYSHFLAGSKDNTVKLLNSGSGLFLTISEIYSSYVGTPKWDYDLDLSMAVKDFVALGFATIGMEMNEDMEWVPFYVPAKNYFRQDGVDYIIRRYVDEDKDTIKVYTLLQGYQPGLITNELFESTAIDTLEFGIAVPLDTITETEDLDPEVTLEGDFSPLFVIKENEMDQFPVSIYEKVMPMIYSVDRKIAMLETQFLKNTESYVLWKNIDLPASLIKAYQDMAKYTDKDGNVKYKSDVKGVDVSRVGRHVRGSEDSAIEFVDNTNPLVDKAIEYNQDQVRMVSSMTSIPQEFLGLEQRNSAVGEGSRALMHGAFMKQIENIRVIFDKYLRQIEELTNSLSNEDMSYTRPDVFMQDEKEVIESVRAKIDLGLITTLRAIQQVEGFSEEQAEMEIDRIQEESLLNGIQQDG